MPEYIEREELFRVLHKFYYKNPPYDSSYQEGYNRGLDCASHEIGKLQAADVAPVRHGQWIDEPDGGTMCSACNQRVREVTGGRSNPVDLSNLPYCPKCGARMNR